MKHLILPLLLCVGIPQSALAQDKSLDSEMKLLLERRPMVGTKVSILVKNLKSGQVIYSLNPDLRLHPASNTKLVTTAVALKELGSTYRWTTELVTPRFENGVAHDLFLVGRGDPRFVTESLNTLIRDAKLAGLRRVDGDLIIDDSWFTAERMAPGFDDKDQDSAYRAATGAVSLNFNSVSIKLKPASEVGKPPIVSIRPDSGHIHVDNQATTSRRGRERLRLSAQAFGDKTSIKITGTIPLKHRGIQTRRRIDNPALYAGDAAAFFLKEAGIKLSGTVKIGQVPGKTKRLSRLSSRRLSHVIDDVNKHSNNFMAEHLVRTLGAVKGRRGDWTEGNRIVSDHLKGEFGLDGFTFVNGSGLFGRTAFSAKEMVTILEKMFLAVPALPEFISSLAVNGRDGTLRRRMKGIEPGRVRAKTGTLNGVVCLSGYLWLKDDTPAAFSILINEIPGPAWPIWKIQDSMVETILKFPIQGEDEPTR